MGYKVILEQLLPIIAHMLEEEKPEVGWLVVARYHAVVVCSSCQGCFTQRVDDGNHSH